MIVTRNNFTAAYRRPANSNKYKMIPSINKQNIA